MSFPYESSFDSRSNNLARRTSLLFGWINSTWPHPGHVFVKGAVPATGSAYFALCGDRHTPRHVDLALLEHGTNDRGIEHRMVNMELFVRRVLTRSRRGAAGTGFARAVQGDTVGAPLGREGG